MRQTDITTAQSRAMAEALYREFGYQGALDYVTRMKQTVTLESNRKVWADVLQELRVRAHRLVFRPDFVEWVIQGRKTATTRRRVKLHPGEEFYILDGQGVEHGFRVTEVREAAASDIIGMYWHQEGYSAPLEMAMDLARIYEDVTPETPMAIHFFEAIA